MADIAALDPLLQARRLWRGRGTPAPAAAAQPTGVPALDAALPGGGWPEHALSELLFAADGLGELSLLLPTLARLGRAGREVVLVGPPYLPYAPALQRAGLCLSRLHVVDARGRDALWAFEQCLRSGACGAVVGWPLEADDRALRRLQLAAETGRALAFALRPARAAANASPAALRLRLDAGADGIRLEVLKCRGGNAVGRVDCGGNGGNSGNAGTGNAGMEGSRQADILPFR